MAVTWTTDDVRARARPYFGDVAPSHDWEHVCRVATLAETLAATGVDEQVLLAAVWLHDIGRGREDLGEIDDHAVWGAREAERILVDLGATDETIEAVTHSINAHRCSNAVEPETREAKLLCDADDLDALRAVGVARCFSYGGGHGTTIHDPDLPPEADDVPASSTGLNPLRKKILELPERMYTQPGRELATERRAFVIEYLDRFEREVAGDA